MPPGATCADLRGFARICAMVLSSVGAGGGSVPVVGKEVATNPADGGGECGADGCRGGHHQYGWQGVGGCAVVGAAVGAAAAVVTVPGCGGTLTGLWPAHPPGLG